MKKIEAIIKPFKLRRREGSPGGRTGFEGMTVSEVKGFGQQERATRRFIGGSEYTVDFLPKIKLEVVLADDLAIAMDTNRQGSQDRQDW